MAQIDRKEVYEEYMRRVNQIAEDCDWVTHIGPETLVNLVISIIEEKYNKEQHEEQ
jgi:hypothetical protein